MQPVFPAPLGSTLREAYFLLGDLRAFVSKTPEEDGYIVHRTDAAIKRLRAEIVTNWEIICGSASCKELTNGYCGDLMPAADWIEAVKSGAFIDYDGHGALCEQPHHAVAVYESDIEIVPSDITALNLSLPTWCTHVIWFNR